jgi:hypothetical protein
MPKIRWRGLPPALRDHPLERLRERKDSAEDLYRLKLWRESEPEAPDGRWYKDFGSFGITAEGPADAYRFGPPQASQGHSARRSRQL